MSRILNENFTRNIEIMRKNIHRGMTKKSALSVCDIQEKELKLYKQYTPEAQEYIKQMRQVVEDGFGGTISAADAMRQLGVEVYHL